MNALKSLASITLLAALTACGGGDEPSHDLADAYVGTWDSFCDSRSAGTSYSTVYDFYKLDRVTLSVTGTELGYANGVCAGAPRTQTVVYSDQMRIVGSTTAGGWPVDMTLDLASGYKDIARIEGRRLYFGDNRVLDSAGYPLYLDDSQYLTRR